MLHLVFGLAGGRFGLAPLWAGFPRSSGLGCLVKGWVASWRRLFGLGCFVKAPLWVGLPREALAPLQLPLGVHLCSLEEANLFNCLWACTSSSAFVLAFHLHLGLQLARVTSSAFAWTGRWPIHQSMTAYCAGFAGFQVGMRHCSN